ncbi:suppressor of fused domain protein [Vagococcus sp. PNs007]|uniref:Suppressor of fused domain protein n=1 Tax=Vagococcus proximus TaxID=2991417 RepID=A0ABT5X471_9ENTE|nr:suppressor of fused domain protein [Vagococcus proximus]MDF0480671.1 suppressor of fused domain protein [Vagococcus proximus]
MEIFVPKNETTKFSRLKKRIALGWNSFNYTKVVSVKENAPGLDAIEKRLSKVYPLITPIYISIPVEKRAKSPIEGFRIYHVNNEYFHIVSLGMSELYSKKAAFSSRYSKYGYEMTAKLKVDTVEECYWLLDKMIEYGEHTKNTECYFIEDEVLSSNNKPFSSEMHYTTCIVSEDPLLGKLETIHGEVQFLQLVGATEKDVCAIKMSRDSYSATQTFLKQLKKENPEMVMDLVKTKN